MRALAWIFLLVGLVSCENPLREQINASKKSQGQSIGLLALARSHFDLALPMAQVFAHYESLRYALASDQLASVSALAEAFSKSVSEEIAKTSGETKRLLQMLGNRLPKFEGKLKDSELRIAFGQVSETIMDLRKQHQFKGLRAFRCPMAKRFSDWLQPESQKISNPYMGKRMIACGFPIEL